MPLRPSSAALTDAYRRAMVVLRERGVRAAKQYWNAIDPDEIDATYQVVQLSLEVQALQREGARLSSGYLLAFIESERQEKIPDPPVVSALLVGRSFSGMPLEEALRGPVLSTKVMIRDTDRPARECLNVFASELEKQVSLSIDNVTRDSLRSGIDASQYCDGWIRAVRGTCAACAGAAEASKKPPGTPLEIHPNCQCVSEPTVKRREPSWMKSGNANYERDLRDMGDLAGDMARGAMNKWDQKHGYEFMQTALRDPDYLPTLVRKAYMGPDAEKYIQQWGLPSPAGLTDAQVESLCAAIQEKVRWLEYYIEKNALPLSDLPSLEGVGYAPFYRVTGMDHLPKSVLNALEDGKQVTLSEPGFLSLARDPIFADYVGGVTGRGRGGRAVWEFWSEDGVKGVRSPFISEGEIVLKPGARFTIKKLPGTWPSNYGDIPRYKVVIRNG